MPCSDLLYGEHGCLQPASSRSEVAAGGGGRTGGTPSAATDPPPGPRGAPPAEPTGSRSLGSPRPTRAPLPSYLRAWPFSLRAPRPVTDLQSPPPPALTRGGGGGRPPAPQHPSRRIPSAGVCPPQASAATAPPRPGSHGAASLVPVPGPPR